MADISVVVVGAGIAGLSASFHLAEKGAGPITLIDKGRVGNGSSSRSGAVNTMLMGTKAATVARGISFDIFERFDRILDDYGFHQVGCLGLYDPQQFAIASQLHDMHRRSGARFEVLRRRELEARFPDLRLEDDEYGVLDLRGGYSEPDRYIPALTAKVRESGVQIREHCIVEDFLIERQGVQGVRLRGGEELRADATVCTVNAWANSLLSLVGQPLPVRNFVHERFVTFPFPEPPRLPATNDDTKGVYYRPTEDNRILLGTEATEPVQIKKPGPDFALIELEPAADSLSFIRQAVRDRLPRMKDAGFDYHRVGLISLPYRPGAQYRSRRRPPRTLPGHQLLLGRLRLPSRGRPSAVGVHRRRPDTDRRQQLLTRSLQRLRHRGLPGAGDFAERNDRRPRRPEQRGCTKATLKAVDASAFSCSAPASERVAGARKAGATLRDRGVGHRPFRVLCTTCVSLACCTAA